MRGGKTRALIRSIEREYRFWLTSDHPDAAICATCHQPIYIGLIHRIFREDRFTICQCGIRAE